MKQHITSQTASRPAFTLIEMLVSTALVVLIMSLFAQIFALATSSITDQRTIARHDQSARVLTQTINNDLLGRTFRQRGDARDLSRGIVPLHPNDNVDADRQRGYFYISENDPASRLDDVLQFTVDLTNVQFLSFSGDGNLPLTFSGRAALIGRPDLDRDNISNTADLVVATGAGNAAQAVSRAGGTDPTTGASDNDIDQPDGDDGVLGNGRTQSRYAEISYFLRGNNLHRRILLLRDLPEGRTGDGQPAIGPNGEFGPLMSTVDEVEDAPSTFGRLPNNYNALADVDPATATNGDWFNDFDIAATRVRFDPENDGPGDGDGQGLSDRASIFVHSEQSLDNAGGSNPLGLPWNRFGHFPNADRDVDNDGFDDLVYSSSTPSTPNTFAIRRNSLPGQPYEFLRSDISDPSNAVRPFFGRFTLGESSHPTFLYPGLPLPIGSHPFHVASVNGLELADERGDGGTNTDSAVVNAFEGGPREGEDVVLTNVLAFDVEVWDDALQRFVEIGEPAAGGVYTDSDLATAGFQNEFALNPFYGPIPYDPAATTVAGTPENRVFDTWHPEIDGYDTFPGLPDPPPIYVTQLPLTANLTQSAFAGVQGPGELAPGNKNNIGNRYEGHWDTKNTYDTGDVVIADLTIPPFATATADYGNAPFALAEAASIVPAAGLAKAAFVAQVRDTNNDTAFDSPHNSPNQQPNWNEVFVNGFVDQPAFNPANDGIRWSLVNDSTLDAYASRDNRVGLKKMRITVTVRDPKSDTIRDLVLVHSFVE